MNHPNVWKVAASFKGQQGHSYKEKERPTSTAVTNTQRYLKHSYQVSLRIVTLWTQHKLANESIQHVLQFVCLMRSVDNVAVILRIKLGLGSQLTAKELGWIY